MSEGISSAASEKVQAGVAKVENYAGAADRFLDKIGNRPWGTWIAAANGLCRKFLPLVILGAGLVSWLIMTIWQIKSDAHISDVLGRLYFPLLTIFSALVAPKAIALVESVLSHREPDAMRPEVLSILRIVLGLGGIVFGVFKLLNFTVPSLFISLGAFVLAFVLIVVLSNPAIVSVKAANPKDSVEEIVGLVAFPIKVVMSLLAILIAVAAVVFFVWGIVDCFSIVPVGVGKMSLSVFVPFLAPLALYVGYLKFMVLFDLLRAIVSVPQKIAELGKKN